eukprot:6214402-Pleurochrysis_carterae.AAC.2
MSQRCCEQVAHEPSAAPARAVMTHQASLKGIFRFERLADRASSFLAPGCATYAGTKPNCYEDDVPSIPNWH